MAPPRKKTSGFGETIRTIIYAVAIALVVRTVAFEPFNIPSGSMIPTLLVGDYLFVSKYSYGYSKHSLPLSLPLFSGRIFFHEPKQGDVVVFKFPKDNSTDYIKRVIGLPGDHVQVSQGVLIINGKPVERRKVQAITERNGQGNVGQIIAYAETLPSGVTHLILQMDGDEQDSANNTPDFVVPPGEYFMMGDNRDDSSDSRIWGFVPAENLVGKAQIIFFSTDQSAAIWEVWRWPWAIRWNRFFQLIH